MTRRRRRSLDERRADALVSGAMTPESAPADLVDLAHTIDALGRVERAEPFGDPAFEAFADRVAERRDSPAIVPLVGRGRRVRPRRAIVVIAAAAAGVVVVGGLAGADALPGPLQRIAHTLLDHVGISVPDRRSDGSADTGIEVRPHSGSSDSPSGTGGNGNGNAGGIGNGNAGGNGNGNAGGNGNGNAGGNGNGNAGGNGNGNAGGNGKPPVT